MNTEISNIETDKGNVYAYYSVAGIDAEKAYKMTLKEYCKLACETINEGENKYSMNMPGMEVAVFIGNAPKNFTYLEFYNCLSKSELAEVESAIIEKIENEIELVG